MPAAVMTYTSLVTDIPVYCERVNDAELSAQIPRLVMLAENRVATDLKVEGTERVVQGNLTLNNAVLDKPAFWRDTLSLMARRANGEIFAILPRLYEYCQQYAPNPAVTGEPRFYANYDFGHFFLAPTPNFAFPFQLIYHARLDPLSDTNQTNWMTVNAPQNLFYAVMLETQTFLKNLDKAQFWAGLYNDSLTALRTEDAGRKQDRTIVPL